MDFILGYQSKWGWLQSNTMLLIFFLKRKMFILCSKLLLRHLFTHAGFFYLYVSLKGRESQRQNLTRKRKKKQNCPELSRFLCVSVYVSGYVLRALSYLTKGLRNHISACHVLQRNAFNVSHSRENIGTCTMKRQLLKSIMLLWSHRILKECVHRVVLLPCVCVRGCLCLLEESAAAKSIPYACLCCNTNHLPVCFDFRRLILPGMLIRKHVF